MNRRGRLGITPREREILRLIGRGMTTMEVAQALSVSHHTVRTHIANAMRKLGASTRTRAAVIVALDEGQRCGL